MEKSYDMTLNQENTSATAGVVGATGSTGVELMRCLAAHPGIDLRFGTSREFAGRPLRDVDPAAPAVVLFSQDEVDPASVDCVFVCLPHGASAPVVERLLAEGARKIVDLSGDLRLADRTTHEATYGSERSEALATEAAYGLPELNREAVRSARVVANPGCYATAVAVALAPLAEAGHLPQSVWVDAKSGVSGAGRAATPTTHFCSAHDDIRPYKIGRVHRHVPEVEQTLENAGNGSTYEITFVPHLVPLERGILATCAVAGSGLGEGEARQLYRERFADEPFIDILAAGDTARIRSVAHSDRAALSIHEVDGRDQLVIVSAIDNLGKGAAGQAIQNANLMLGRPETEGLRIH